MDACEKKKKTNKIVDEQTKLRVIIMVEILVIVDYAYQKDVIS